MYKESIKKNSNYVRPFVEGIKYYGSKEIVQGIGSMIILNKEGHILTCRHIAEHILNSICLSEGYSNLIGSLKKAQNKEERKKIEKQFNLKRNTVVLSRFEFLLETPENAKIEIKMHDYLDLAIIKIEGIKIEVDNYPIFSKTLPEQGQSLCKIGYAFPEYDLFEYSDNDENIIIKDNRIMNFPLFPIDGIVTRYIVDENNYKSMFETSTPGLKGQSGGPIFSPEGIVYGIQSMTKHLDLDFDVNQIVKRGIENKNVSFTPFINLGVGISSVEIIKFLEENEVEFNCI